LKTFRDFIWLFLQNKEEGNYNNNNKDIYRLFLVGQKQLPEIVEGKLLQRKGIGH
jgi:hypothetical protein